MKRISSNRPELESPTLRSKMRHVRKFKNFESIQVSGYYPFTSMVRQQVSENKTKDMWRLASLNLPDDEGSLYRDNGKHLVN
jgi:hypothetical protein